MSMDEVQALFPDIDVSTALEQLASIQQFTSQYSSSLEGLASMFGEGLSEEVLKIATELDMTGAQANWDAFAANPGAITTDAIIEGIVSDGKVILPGFGTFETRQRSARSGRNPRTGETIKIKATKAPAFKPGKGMKDAVAKKKK